MNRVYLSLGSNLNDRLVNIDNAILSLSEKITIGKISSVYETEPQEMVSDNLFLNMVVSGKTSLSPRELLNFICGIEKSMGRVRTGDSKYSDRIIDIDILFFNDIVISDDDLTIPHKRLHKRLFVLAPMVDIAPSFIHPVLGKKIDTLFRSVDSESLQVDKFSEVSSGV